MNATRIQQAFYHHSFQRYELLAPNVFMSWDNEMDLVGIRRSGYIDEIEIKLSISDFKADFKKISVVEGAKKEVGRNYFHNEQVEIFKHDALQHGLIQQNYFSFLLPETIASKCNIPEYAGLYVFYTDNAGVERIKEEKKAPLLHKRKINEAAKYDVGRKMTYRYWQKFLKA